MAICDCLVEGRAAMSISLEGCGRAEAFGDHPLAGTGADVTHRIDEHGKKGLVSPETRNDR